jgi:hypothetical protein
MRQIKFQFDVSPSVKQLEMENEDTIDEFQN